MERVLPPECPVCGTVPGSGTPHVPSRALAITVSHIMISHPLDYAEWKRGRRQLPGLTSGADNGWEVQP